MHCQLAAVKFFAVALVQRTCKHLPGDSVVQENALTTAAEKLAWFRAVLDRNKVDAGKFHRHFALDQVINADPPTKTTSLLKAGHGVMRLFCCQYCGKVGSIGACCNQCKPHQTQFHEPIARVGRSPVLASEKSKKGTEEETYKEQTWSWIADDFHTTPG